MLYGNGLRKFKKFRRDQRSCADLKDNDSNPVSQALCDEIIAQTLILKKDGQYNEALDLLELVATDGNPDCSQVAIYELALLHSQLGNFSEADKYLTMLGFILKLSNSIICPSSAPSDQKQATSSVRHSSDAPVVVFDDVLPPNLLQPLLDAFSPSSTFWSEHKYPTDEFFSYSCKKSDDPSLMSQIIEVVTPLIDSHFKDTKILSRSCSVEWWCHKRDESSGFAHQLHFDLDENSLQSYKDQVVSQQMKDDQSSGSTKDSENCLREDLHPLVSAVLYLSEQKHAAPTLVTDQTLDAGSVATQAWLCHPAENRLLLFDGKLLHGVVPFLPPKEKTKKSALNSESSPRITIMMGFWAKDFNNVPSTSKLGPNMAMPTFSSQHNKKTEGEKKSAATWPSLLSAVESSSNGRSKVPSKRKNAGLVHIPGPIWVPVKGTTQSKGKQLRGKSVPRIAESSRKSAEIVNEKVLADSSDFVSIEDLERLREAPSVGISDDEDDNAVPQTVKRKHRMKSGIGEVCDDAVEYMSIADLNKLRDSDVDKKSTAVAADQKPNGKKSSVKTNEQNTSLSERPSEIVFVGKWFLKSESEIRDDVLLK